MATPSVASSPFADKVVIVTGGNSGIGEATVDQFLKAGAKVAVLDIRSPQTEIESSQRLDIVCDVGVEDSVEFAVAQVLEKWGTIDILCNVAGVMDAMSRVSETETFYWERCFKVNVNGPFYLIRACTKHFLAKPKTDPVTNRGSIVNVASVAAQGGAFAGAAYTASKHALLGLNRNTAFMYAKEGIKCNAVLPGGVPTNIAQNSGILEELSKQPAMATIGPVQATMPSLAQAVDVAKAILFLAGSESVNGAELTVDCGWSTL